METLQDINLLESSCMCELCYEYPNEVHICLSFRAENYIAWISVIILDLGGRAKRERENRLWLPNERHLFIYGSKYGRFVAGA